MRRTILSENQYETKFITAANRNATTSPFAPPKYSPIARSTALRSPSRSAVLIPFAMISILPFSRLPFFVFRFAFRVLALLCEATQQLGEERRAPGKIRNHDMLVMRVRAVARG